MRAGLVTLDQLSDALRENISSGRAVEEIVVARGWVTADAVARLQAAKQGLVMPPAVAPVPPAAPVSLPAPEPPPAPVAVAPPPPAVAPAPAPSQAVPAPPPPIVQTGDQPNGSVGVFLNLADGERLWVGRFDSAEAGEQRASEIIDTLMRPEPGVWPRFGNRLVRPGSVVAVEVSRRRDE